MKDLQHIITENAKRRQALNEAYNPLTGEGSPLERRALQIEPGTVVWLPIAMFDEPIVQQIRQEGGIRGAAESVEVKEAEYRKAFTDCRFGYDYEFWCASCVTIEDNEGKLVPLVLNRAQRISLKHREQQRMNNEPVRQLELKYRQYGSTTEKNAYIVWLQNIVYEGYNAYICSLDTDGAKEILSRYDRIAEHYPSAVGNIRIQGYRGARNTLQIKNRRAKINIGSAERPNAPSGRSVQAVLISEAGKMKSTTKTGAEKLITNMMSMVKMAPHTFVLIESTAESVGKWFREEVYRARNDNEESGFELTFISWIEDNTLQKTVDDYESFIKSFGEYDWFLWELGATLEQINWYRHREKEYPAPWMMKQEFPSTVEEAFQGSGRRVFVPTYVQNARKTCREPKYIGNLYADGQKGKAALKGIAFEPEPKGSLRIWAKPDDPKPEKPIRRRYCAFVDIGGRTKEADYSVVSVFDRYWMLYGGGPERVATWRGHLDQDLFAWVAARIAKWYQNALLAVEVNSLKREAIGNEGQHHKTVLDEISKHYRNLYTRTDPEKVREGAPTRYGFHTNPASKDMIINTLNGALRDEIYVERDYVACDEMDAYELKDDGSMGAKQGMHDDVLMTTAGNVWLATERMRSPSEDQTKQMYEKYNRNNQYNEAML
jgi:hypothetical protein